MSATQLALGIIITFAFMVVALTAIDAWKKVNGARLEDDGKDPDA